MHPKLRLVSLVFLVAATPAFGAYTVTDDFSSYGAHLNTGDGPASGHYQWNVVHSVPGFSHELGINGGRLKLAGYSHPTHPGTIAGVATATYAPGTQPKVEGFTIEFDFHEYHDLIKLDIQIEGSESHTIQLIDFPITYPATGHLAITFGATSLTETITGHAPRVIPYSSIGSGSITGSDIVDSFTFTGVHRNNGQDVAEISNLVVSVPEPGSLALSGLGGWLLLRRRR